MQGPSLSQAAASGGPPKAVGWPRPVAGPEEQQHLDPSAAARPGCPGCRGRDGKEGGEEKGPVLSPFNLALSLAESLGRGAPPQIEET